MPGHPVVEYGCIESLKAAINPNTAAFIVEPIQGEAGIIIPPKGYLEAAQQLCQENNVMFVVDEIQTGLGRTGKMFCFQYENVKPDGVIVGKALSGGFYPVSAFLSRKELMDVFTPGNHGSTFGGNPLACAVARKALQVLREEKLVERSFELGQYFMEKLKELESPYVQEIRGRGLMVGIELNRPARAFCEALKTKGVLCKETHENVLRFSPPLVITQDELDWAYERIAAVLTDQSI
jgi:ornithine--oxo-acid transaminase